MKGPHPQSNGSTMLARYMPGCCLSASALYFICYLDRANIGFAALTVNKDAWAQRRISTGSVRAPSSGDISSSKSRAT